MATRRTGVRFRTGQPIPHYCTGVSTKCLQNDTRSQRVCGHARTFSPPIVCLFLHLSHSRNQTPGSLIPDTCSLLPLPRFPSPRIPNFRFPAFSWLSTPNICAIIDAQEIIMPRNPGQSPYRPPPAHDHAQETPKKQVPEQKRPADHSPPPVRTRGCPTQGSPAGGPRVSVGKPG